jgi:hypothetical protein
MKNKKVNNLSFGILFFIVFLILGFYPMYKGDNPNIYFLVLSLPFIILGFLNSKILTPFNRRDFRFNYCTYCHGYSVFYCFNTYQFDSKGIWQRYS